MIAGHVGKTALVMALSVALLQGCSHIKLKGAADAEDSAMDDVAMRPATLPEPEAVSLPHLPSLPETTMEEPIPMGVSVVESDNLGYVDTVTPPEPVAMAAEPEYPPANYSLQLLGTTNMLAAQKFIDDNGLGDSATIGATTHRGNAWFVVLYGAYETSTEARSGLSGLPSNVRAMKPWPRSLDSL